MLLASAQRNMDQGDYGTCAHELRAILAVQADHLPALEMLARCFWKHGQFESALDAIGVLVQINPYEPGYFHLKGMVCESLGHIGAAINAYRRCLEHESSPAAKQSAVELRRLLEWQTNALEALMAEDRQFRAAYRRNPARACEERGFQYVEPQELRFLGLLVPSTESLWLRPS